MATPAASAQSPTGVIAVKKFLEHNGRPVGMSEMSEFWKALSPTEKTEFSDRAKQYCVENSIF